MLNIVVDNKDTLIVQESWFKLQGIKELLDNNINLSISSILLKEYEERYYDYNVKWRELLSKYDALKYETEGKRVTLNFNENMLIIE